MANANDYAWSLRAIGQDLEPLHPKAIDLESDETGFIVRAETAGQQEKPASGQSSGGGLGALWRGLRNRVLKEEKPPDQSQASAGRLERHYSAEDLERLNAEGQAKSLEPHKKPELLSLPEILRLVGSYLDTKGARLRRVSTRDQWLTIQYQTMEGEQKTEEHRISSFYDLSVRMYLHRSDRN